LNQGSFAEIQGGAGRAGVPLAESGWAFSPASRWRVANS